MLLRSGWMDELRFYILFNSISVISGLRGDDNGRLCAMEPGLRLRRFGLERAWNMRNPRSVGQVGWLVGCFGFNGPLRQYFSLYRAVSQREGVRKEKR